MMIHGVASWNGLAKPVWRALRQPDLFCTSTCISVKTKVDPTRLELVTSAMRRRRSPN
jgi:hypothetical protein